MLIHPLSCTKEGLRELGSESYINLHSIDIAPPSIPNRLKSKFFAFNMVLPSTVSVDNIYGSMCLSLSEKFGAGRGLEAIPEGRKT